MTTLGNCINISHLLTSEQATFFAQVVGCANVVRNQKILEFRENINNKEIASQGYAHVKKREGLDFLKNVPVQILRNAAASFCVWIFNGNAAILEREVKPKRITVHIFLANNFADRPKK